MLDTGLCQPCRHLEQKRQAEREAEGEDGWVRMEAARLSVLEGAGARDGLRCAPHLHSMLAGEGLLPPHAICSPPESRKPLPTGGGQLEAEHFPQMVGNLTERGGAVCPHL